MKTILIVGANVMQIPLISKAKALGYRVVVSGEEMQPGLSSADVDVVRIACSADKEAVLRIAREERVDGVISNAPLFMTTVAYVAEKLGLVGNPVEGIAVLEAKAPFRRLQHKLGLFAPKFAEPTDYISFVRAGLGLRFPIMVKPDLRVGTIGQTKLGSKWRLPFSRHAFAQARRRSQNGRVCIEEFVPIPGPIAVEGEVCVYRGRYFWDGLCPQIRSRRNPLLVSTNVFPARLSATQLAAVQDAVRRIFGELGIVHGQFNLEGYFVDSGEFFILEINPRQGGDGLSKWAEMACGIDFDRLLVETAVGEFGYLESLDRPVDRRRYLLRHKVYSDRHGIYRGLTIAPELQGTILDREERDHGTEVHPSESMDETVAHLTVEFGSQQELYAAAVRMEELVVPIID